MRAITRNVSAQLNIVILSFFIRESVKLKPARALKVTPMPLSGKPLAPGDHNSGRFVEDHIQFLRHERLDQVVFIPRLEALLLV